MAKYEKEQLDKILYDTYHGRLRQALEMSDIKNIDFIIDAVKEKLNRNIK